jgi:hypothetical protein
LKEHAWKACVGETLPWVRIPLSPPIKNASKTTDLTNSARSSVRPHNAPTLETLHRETGEEFDDTLSKADASKQIDELRQRSPRLAQE